MQGPTESAGPFSCLSNRTFAAFRMCPVLENGEGLPQPQDPAVAYRSLFSQCKVFQYKQASGRFPQSQFCVDGAHRTDSQCQKGIQIHAGLYTLPNAVTVDTGSKRLVLHFLFQT